MNLNSSWKTDVAASKPMYEVFPKLQEYETARFLLCNSKIDDEICSFWKEAVNKYCWEKGVYEFNMSEMKEEFQLQFQDPYSGEAITLEPFNLGKQEVLKVLLESGALIKRRDLEIKPIVDITPQPSLLGKIGSFISSPFSSPGEVVEEKAIISDTEQLVAIHVLDVMQQLLVAHAGTCDVDSLVMYATEPVVEHIRGEVLHGLTFPAFVRQAIESIGTQNEVSHARTPPTEKGMSIHILQSNLNPPSMLANVCNALLPHMLNTQRAVKFDMNTMDSTDAGKRNRLIEDILPVVGTSGLVIKILPPHGLINSPTPAAPVGDPWDTVASPFTSPTKSKGAVGDNGAISGAGVTEAEVSMLQQKVYFIKLDADLAHYTKEIDALEADMDAKQKKCDEFDRKIATERDEKRKENLKKQFCHVLRRRKFDLNRSTNLIGFRDKLEKVKQTLITNSDNIDSFHALKQGNQAMKILNQKVETELGDVENVHEVLDEVAELTSSLNEIGDALIGQGLEYDDEEELLAEFELERQTLRDNTAAAALPVPPSHSTTHNTPGRAENTPDKRAATAQVI